MLVAAITIFPCGPVSIDQIPVEPEQGICVVEVREDFLLGHVHIQILQKEREIIKVFIILKQLETVRKLVCCVVNKQLCS